MPAAHAVSARRAVIGVLCVAVGFSACTSDDDVRSVAPSSTTSSARPSTTGTRQAVDREVLTEAVAVRFGTGLGPPERPRSLEPRTVPIPVDVAGCIRVRFDATARLAATTGPFHSYDRLIVRPVDPAAAGASLWSMPFQWSPDPLLSEPPTVDAPIPLRSPWFEVVGDGPAVAFGAEYMGDRGYSDFAQTWELDSLRIRCEGSG